MYNGMTPAGGRKSAVPQSQPYVAIPHESKDELEALREEMAEQRVQVREDFAADLGGDPECYNADTHHVDEPVTDGGPD